MDQLEQLIGEKDILSRITQYELQKEEGRVFIYVHEILTGEGKGLFVAYPTWIVGRTKEQYTTTGQSADEALAKCIFLIKGVSLDEIRERSSDKDSTVS